MTGDVADFITRLPGCELALPGDLQTTDRAAAEKAASASAKAAEEYEASLVAANFDGETPAHYAARWGHLDCLRALHELGTWRTHTPSSILLREMIT